MPKIVELRQERGLVRSNFDGYKLFLEPVPLLRQELQSAPSRAEPSDEQYSLLHAELFSMHNLLTVDPWSRTMSYFINRLGEIVRCAYDENKGSPLPMQVIFKINQKLSNEEVAMPMWKRKGEYNISLRFISEKYCVLCDGVNTLLLLETGDRIKANEWKLIATSDVQGSGMDLEERNYIIYDARLDIIQEQKQVSLALGHVQRVEPLKPEGNSTHFMYLYWMKWSLQQQEWRLEVLDTLESKGSLYYCAFEPRSESLIISSNREFIWRSTKEKEGNEIDTERQEKAQLHDKSKEEENVINDFTWIQTDDDIVVKFDIKPGMDRNNYHVKCISNKLTVKCNDSILLDNDLKEKIDHDLTTWTIVSVVYYMNIIMTINTIQNIFRKIIFCKSL